MRHVLYLKGRRRPYTIILNESVVAKWLAEGYIEPWLETSKADKLAYRKVEGSPSVRQNEGKG